MSTPLTYCRKIQSAGFLKSQVTSGRWMGSCCLLVGLMILFSRSANAQDKGTSIDLPLRRVVLFNAGVGFFERQATVEGPVEAELRFRTEDINDLLKSMVVRDPTAEQSVTVTYGSKDPVTKALRSFAIDLTDDPTLTGLLQQIRGEKVEVRAPERLEATVVGVETHEQKVDDAVITVEYVNLLTEAGLRRIDVSTIAGIRLLNPKLQSELNQALAVLATAHSKDKKTVRVSFPGKGKRSVRVGYVQEAPIWKTSYRLVLEEDKTAHLQGWALVENTSDEDWSNVSLQLVSGRPIAFTMNLYDPLYLQRPVVELELFSSLRPPIYERALAKRSTAKAAPQAPETRRAGAAVATEQGAADSARGGFGMGGNNVGRFLLGGPTMSQAAEVGELFQYAIDSPVTLARQRSAMLPIVAATVEVEKLSIFNPGENVKHPVNGLRLKNTTQLHLMQGPITVFDDKTYAGDARIMDMAPGEERLIGYALDLDTDVSKEGRPGRATILSVKIVRGLVESQRKYRRSVRYVIRSVGDKEKTVLIQHPRDQRWKLVEPDTAVETTPSEYRFAVRVKPGKTVALLVSEEMVQREQIALSDLNERTIQMFVQATSVSEQIKQALRDIARRKAEIAQLENQKKQLEAEVATIEKEQARIRQNMQAIGRSSTLYNRYVQKFSNQEDRIESLQEKLRALSIEIDKRKAQLASYLENLVLGDQKTGQ